MGEIAASSRPSVALVIGSGSVKCAAALGLQRVLQREGIDVEMVVGCSGGSLYAAAIALGLDVNTTTALTLRLWTRQVSQRANRRAILQALLPRLFGFDARFGLRDDGQVLARLREAFGDQTFADARVPLFLCATDFETGAQMALHTGSLVAALRASIAVPFIFAPSLVDGRLMLDGCLSDPLPVGVAMREGARVIVAMGFESPYQSRIDSPARFAFQISSIMNNNLLRANYAFHSLAHHAEVISIVPEFNTRIRLFDVDKIPYVIEEGERAAEAQLPYLRRLLAAPA
jgi:NTE family protein